MDTTVYYVISGGLVGLIFSIAVSKSRFFRMNPWYAQMLMGIIAISTTTLLFIWYFFE